VDCESSKGKGLRVLFADSTRPLRNMHGLWHPGRSARNSCYTLAPIGQNYVYQALETVPI
jgi:hypothetical protein